MLRQLGFLIAARSVSTFFEQLALFQRPVSGLECRSNKLVQSASSWAGSILVWRQCNSLSLNGQTRIPSVSKRVWLANLCRQFAAPVGAVHRHRS